MKTILNFTFGLIVSVLAVIFLLGALSAFHTTPAQAVGVVARAVYHAGAYMGKAVQQP